jgi:hypothetical protein
MIDPAQVQRHGELCLRTSKQLGEMLQAKGYQLTRLKRKQDKVAALLFLEGWPVVMDVIDQIGVERLDGGQVETGVAAASET